MENVTLISFDGVKGVGAVRLSLRPDQQAYALIGSNGIGKTKTLEALFQVLFFTHRLWQGQNFLSFSSLQDSFVFAKAEALGKRMVAPRDAGALRAVFKEAGDAAHEIPVVFLASQNRGFVRHQAKAGAQIGTLKDRRQEYIERVVKGIRESFSSLNMDVNIEDWFITRAQSSNRYQSAEDSREVEITTVLSILHKLEPDIDAQFLEITGDGRVSIKIKGQKRELSHLSTGFASILKLVQAIVSGYGCYTNETELQRVRGFVLIDEIESHLHIMWQARIIPLLKELFPNTTFFVTTHSPIVLTQLSEGEAYRLKRDDKGVVIAQTIRAPNRAALVDILNDAFDIDLNKLKKERMSGDQQQEAKNKLLSLLNESEAQG